MQRYLLFGGYMYYPMGGWGDYMNSFDDEETARKYLIGFSGDWAQIVESTKGVIVWEWNRENNEMLIRS